MKLLFPQNPMMKKLPDSIFEHEFDAAQRRFAGDSTPIPRPPHWGGYRLVASAMEFWQGRRSRLHDRLRYRREGDAWVRERLAP